MKILISGDFCPIGRTDKYLKEERYEELFNGFNKVVESVDYAIVNFECPITLSNQKLLKTGPCIKTENLNSLKALKYVGFDLLTLANNYIQDYGSKVYQVNRLSAEYTFPSPLNKYLNVFFLKLQLQRAKGNFLVTKLFNLLRS